MCTLLKAVYTVNTQIPVLEVTMIRFPPYTIKIGAGVMAGHCQEIMLQINLQQS